MNQSLDVNLIRGCLEGVVPSTLATVATDGTPNITYVSQVHYVDAQHVALSFQFFNKTRENILVNPDVMVQVVDPDSSAHFRLSMRYLRTETEGKIFEKMKAGLAGIASHTGMSKIFQLLGADIYQVLQIEGVSNKPLTCAIPQRNHLAALRDSVQLLQKSADLQSLIEKLMQGLQQHFEFMHGMLLMYDQRGERLYSVDSFGYSISGIGAEIPLGVGVIGIAAKELTPIRIMYLTGKYSYNTTVRDNLLKSNPALELETEIPFAGLAEPHSQLAVPVVERDKLLGVIYLDSHQDLRFTYEDEDALLVLADCFAQRVLHTNNVVHLESEKSLNKSRKEDDEKVIVIRRFQSNDSIFVDEEYLIKGVAGAIFWKLLKCFEEHNRTEFSNRELRLDPAIGLPDVVDNLEARLILLQKRLSERCDFLRIVKSGRGRFNLQIDRTIILEEV